MNKIEIELYKRAQIRSKRNKKRSAYVKAKNKYLNDVYKPDINDSLSMKILKSKIPLLKKGLISGICVSGFVNLNPTTIKYIQNNGCMVENNIIVSEPQLSGTI